jgi:plastocyanin
MNRNIPIRVAAAASALAVAASLAGPAFATHGASVDRVSLAIKSDTEHAKKGADGKWHDAYLPGAFAVESGDKVVVTIRNYDAAAHTFTSARLGLDVVITGGSATHPSVTTFTFTAPKAGTYTWRCLGNCDAWAMSHVGFMKGRITVTT